MATNSLVLASTILSIEATSYIPVKGGVLLYREEFCDRCHCECVGETSEIVTDVSDEEVELSTVKLGEPVGGRLKVNDAGEAMCEVCRETTTWTTMPSDERFP